MKTLPTLYSRTSNGDIQTWTMEVAGAGYRTITGRQGGTLTFNDFKYAEGKNEGRSNETSPEQQALSEATAHWNKRKEFGYFENVKDVDNELAGVDVMLAATLDNYLDPKKPKKYVWNRTKTLLVQNKYNGVRCTARLEKGEVVLRSRGFKIWKSVPHINASLVKFFQDYPTAVLDGELYNYDLRQKLNELISIVRNQKPTAADFVEAEQKVRYYVYDGYGFSPAFESDCPYCLRKAFIDRTLPKYSKYFATVKTSEVDSTEHLDKLYESFLADGDEGAIARFPDSPYEHGRRSEFLLKYKPEDDAEGEIIDIEEGEGNWAGAAKVIWLSWNGKVFKGTMRGSYEENKAILENKEAYIGLEVTFFYTGLTGKGTPNYARVDPSNCLKADR